MATKFAREAEGLNSVEAPTFLNHHNGIDENVSGGAAAMKNWMANTLKRAEGVNARRTLVDPTITHAANLRQIEREVEKFSKEAAEGLKQARAAMRDSIASADAKLRTAVAVSPTSNAAEIRSALRGMSAKDRTAAMREAFANHDREVLGAIVDFNKVMHGCDKETVEVLFEKFKQEVAPNELANLASNRRFAEWGDKSEQFVLRFGTQALKGTEAYAATRARNAAVLASYGMNIDE